MPENTPSVEGEYLCAAKVQKTNPIAEVATVFASRYSEPRYSASPRIFRSALARDPAIIMASLS
jgi:hypothetical protein